MNLVPIPGPHPLPLVGNYRDIDPVNPVQSLWHLADVYGPIFKMTLGGEERIFVSTQALLNEICDEKRFMKAVKGALTETRNAVKDGLFTAFAGEHNWEIAHRVLMPAFGTMSIKNMFDEMHDIAGQLVYKWARFDNERIDVVSDFTRLTLDTLALCAMDTRFNSFYSSEMHPFIKAMGGMLVESGNRSRRIPFTNYLMRGAQKQYDEDIAVLRRIASEVVEQRRAHPKDKKDLLNAMILGKDPKTGEGMTDESIANNMITFMIAGHETTSGLLSFLLYYLLKNPKAYQTVQKEIDTVIGRKPINVEHMAELPYLTACLRETLRLSPPVRFQLQAKRNSTDEPIILGGKYAIKSDVSILALVDKVHRDPEVYGEDAEEFKPELMLDEPFSKLPPNSWKPFGNGVRACIGRPFAWQEALLVAAMLLQNFDFRLDDPSYTLQIKETLTTKPSNFYVRATLRDNISAVHLEKLLYVAPPPDPLSLRKDVPNVEKEIDSQGKKPMSIFYGSNAGTCESIAQSLARNAAQRGYDVNVGPLDSAVGKIPTTQPVVLISSSYEGEPPDNATHFVEWVKDLKGGQALRGVRYAVFGVGNHDWVSTFYKVPKAIDIAFSANGATRLVESGFGDVAAGDIFNEFDIWQDNTFWPALGSSSPDVDSTGLIIDIDISSRPSYLRQDVRPAVIESNTLLTGPGIPEKRHVVIRLPTGMNYKAGDYLSVLPLNHTKNIHRVLARFGIPWDAMITVKQGSNTILPTGHPLSVTDILGAYVELSQPATQKNVEKIASTLTDQTQKSSLLELTGDSFDSQVTKKRLSALDILELYPDAALPFSAFLEMLPSMRIRQYSISSSPLANAGITSITISVLDVEHEVTGKRYLGVASTHLSSMAPGDVMHVSVKPGHGAFHPPADIESVPMIMICAGTGLAPFRAFVEERAIQKAAGRTLAPAYLFIGCTHPDKDRLYGSELDIWSTGSENSVVEVFYAFSQKPAASEGCKHVQDRLWFERKKVVELFEKGAKIYMCGSGAVGESVADIVKKIYVEYRGEHGETETAQQAEEWFKNIKRERFTSDVFG